MIYFQSWIILPDCHGLSCHTIFAGRPLGGHKIPSCMTGSCESVGDSIEAWRSEFKVRSVQ